MAEQVVYAGITSRRSGASCSEIKNVRIMLYRYQEREDRVMKMLGRRDELCVRWPNARVTLREPQERENHVTRRSSLMSQGKNVNITFNKSWAL